MWSLERGSTVTRIDRISSANTMPVSGRGFYKCQYVLSDGNDDDDDDSEDDDDDDDDGNGVL